MKKATSLWFATSEDKEKSLLAHNSLLVSAKGQYFHEDRHREFPHGQKWTFWFLWPFHGGGGGGGRREAAINGRACSRRTQSLQRGLHGNIVNAGKLVYLCGKNILNTRSFIVIILFMQVPSKMWNGFTAPLFNFFFIKLWWWKAAAHSGRCTIYLWLLLLTR